MRPMTGRGSGMTHRWSVGADVTRRWGGRAGTTHEVWGGRHDRRVGCGEQVRPVDGVRGRHARHVGELRWNEVPISEPTPPFLPLFLPALGLTYTAAAAVNTDKSDCIWNSFWDGGREQWLWVEQRAGGARNRSVQGNGGVKRTVPGLRSVAEFPQPQGCAGEADRSSMH